MSSVKGGKCAYCGKHTEFASLDFMTWMCSDICEDAYTDEYLVATMKPYTLKEFREAFERVVDMLNTERRKRVELQHKLEGY